MRSLVRILVTILFLLVARTAEAEISIQLGTDSAYDPQRFCWADLSCPGVAAVSPDKVIPLGNRRLPYLKCIASKQHPADLSGQQCYSLEDIDYWRAGICRPPAAPRLTSSEPLPFTEGATDVDVSGGKTADTIRTVAVSLRGLDVGRVELNGSVVRIVTDATTAVGQLLNDDYTAIGEAKTINVHESLGLAHLVATCRSSFIDVPDGTGELEFDEGDVRAECAEDRTCIGGGLHKIFLNATTASVRTPRLRARVRTHLGGAARDSLLEARWTGAIPDAIKLRLISASLVWKGGCLYQPECTDENEQRCRACPRVGIPVAGIDRCAASFDPTNRACVYTCSQQENSSGFVLPADVTFEVGIQRDNWREKLVQVDQTFSGFADRGDRQFTVRYPANGSESKVNPVDQLDILAPNGAHFDFGWRRRQDALSPETRVSVAGATCQDQLSVQYFGTLSSFEPYALKLEDGGFFQLVEPRRRFRNWWLGGRGSVVMGAYRFEEGHFPGTMGGEVEVVVEHRSYDDSLRAGVILAPQITSHAYRPVAYESSVDDVPTLPIFRLSALGAITPIPPLSDLFPRLQVYLAAGPWVSWPLQYSKTKNVGVQAGAEIELIVQVALHRALTAHIAPYLIAPDYLRTIQNKDFGASTTYTTSGNMQFGVKVGFGLWGPLLRKD